jgi:hypothetical protein
LVLHSELAEHDAPGDFNTQAPVLLNTRLELHSVQSPVPEAQFVQ